MAAPVQIEKIIKMDMFEIVKFQLITHCFVERIKLNETQLNVLSLLGVCGEIAMLDFYKLVNDKGYLNGDTAVNNCLRQIERSNLFIKKKGLKQGKNVYLNPDIGLVSEGSILLNYKIHNIESQKTS